MNCIILISSPGAGKGTVSQYIKDNYNIDHISTGNLLRKKSETSKEMKPGIATLLPCFNSLTITSKNELMKFADCAFEQPTFEATSSINIVFVQIFIAINIKTVCL